VILRLLVFALLTAGVRQAADPEVAKGVIEVENGLYDDAVATLERAAGRLSGDKSEQRERGLAELYLGVAKVEKGLDAEALVRFREALSLAKDLTLEKGRF
jgi:hypothetical protein